MEERTAEFEELLGFFKALGDEKRLKIVGLLAQRSLCVEEMAAILDLSAATVSHHLHKLAKAGLVRASAEGYYNVYSLRADALREMGQRTQVADLVSFVAAVQQAETLGVSIAKVLRVQADAARERRAQRAREAAAKLPVKLLFPLVFFIFPALFVVILGPGAIRFADLFKVLGK